VRKIDPLLAQPPQVGRFLGRDRIRPQSVEHQDEVEGRPARAGGTGSAGKRGKHERSGEQAALAGARGVHALGSGHGATVARQFEGIVKPARPDSRISRNQTFEISKVERANSSSTATLRSTNPCSWAYWVRASISRM